MPTAYTIDASVFINAFIPAEPGYAKSNRLLALLQEKAAPIIVPTLTLPEVATAIARAQADLF